ncbi:MAG: hypothetical protein HDS11_05035 [Bacteroides sp.]|nr:hypothetical protein [Bacteroides sp.]
MRKDNLTLLIHSCHKFSDLWDAHISLLNKNWPDRNIRTIILTDEPESHTFPGVEIISAGSGKEITDRIRHVLPLIETEYVLVTLDDYFPIYPIDGSKIDRLVSVMQTKGYDYIRLFENPRCCNLSATPDSDIYSFTLDNDYVVNLYVGIWRKDFIRNSLSQKSLSAWDYEASLTAAAARIGANCAMSKGKEFPIMDVVRKGKLLRSPATYLKKHNLYHGSRPVRTIKETAFLYIKTQVRRALSYGPEPVLRFIQKMLMNMGMNSFSGKNKNSDK